MQISPYILSIDNSDGSYLIFSTFTTALVRLPKDIYHKIFVLKDFSDQENIQKLKTMGILTDNYTKQLDILNKIYETEMTSRTPVVKIFTTSKCNARCYYCFEAGILQEDMSMETAEQVIKFIRQYYPEKKIQINWFGGEPLMNFKVIKYITDGLIQDGFKLFTHITTNGSLLCEEMVDYFNANYDTVSCQITVDELFEKYYHIKRYVDLAPEKAFDIILSNIELLLESGVSTRIRINFLKTKLSRAIEIFNFLKEKFNKWDNLVIYLAPLTFDDETKVFSEDQLKDTENLHFRLMEFYSQNNIVIDATDEAKNRLSSLSLKPKAISCGACRTKNITITSAGEICKCHRLAKYPERMFGNVWNGIDESNPNYSTFLRSTPLDEECETCKVLPICRGGCRVLSSLQGEKKKVCSIYKYHPELIKLLYDKFNVNCK